MTSVNASLSLQGRLYRVIGMVALGLIGALLLTWYYRSAYAQVRAPRKSSLKALQSKVQGEMTLPPLPRRPAPPMPVDAPAAEPLPGAAPAPIAAPRRTSMHVSSSSGPSVLDRQLKGAVFAELDRARREGAAFAVSGGNGEPRSSNGSGELSSLLATQPVAMAVARRLPTQRLLLPKGAFLDCTLETAIDSSLPGMTTCVTATDTYGADGTVVLLERGSKLVGETRGELKDGGSRLFVLWTEARTPTGVVIPLASPGTDELGRAGLSGEVERHFWSRFGAAILVSVIDGGLQVAANATRGNGTGISISTGGTAQLATEALKETVRIAPTLRKPQGDRIQVLVARDLDFRGVYELRREAP